MANWNGGPIERLPPSKRSKAARMPGLKTPDRNIKRQPAPVRVIVSKGVVKDRKRFAELLQDRFADWLREN